MFSFFKKKKTLCGRQWVSNLKECQILLFFIFFLNIFIGWHLIIFNTIYFNSLKIEPDIYSTLSCVNVSNFPSFSCVIYAAIIISINWTFIGDVYPMSNAKQILSEELHNFRAIIRRRKKKRGWNDSRRHFNVFRRLVKWVNWCYITRYYSQDKFRMV